jgi:FemAB-related protein (PEP-CTERM system-associated)
MKVVDAGSDGAAWNRFIESSAKATFCHQFEWKALIRDVLGHDSLYLAAVDESGDWRGALPLARVRTLLGHHLISMPFLNDGGALGDESAQQLLVEHAVAEAKRSGATLVELRSRDDAPGPVVSSHRKIAVHLPLPETVEDLWAKTFRAKLRSQVRRPTKEGMTARSGAGEVGTFHRVFSRNMRDLGTPVMPRAFFERIASSFGDQALFATVYTREGAPAAAACCLIWRNEIEVTWASSLRELNALAPNMLLYSHLMEEAIKRRLTLFNFGRSTADTPTHRFKQQWGGVDVPLSWPCWPAQASHAVAHAEKPVFRVATAVWQRLPVAVANRLGPSLARLLP